MSDLVPDYPDLNNKAPAASAGLPQSSSATIDKTHVGKKVIFQFSWAVFSFILIKVLDVFYPNLFGAVHMPLYLWLYPFYFVFFVFSLVRRREANIASSIIILLCLLGVSESHVYFGSTWIFQALKTRVFSGRYASCASEAVPVGAGRGLKLCDNYDRIGYFDGIVFDSTGEITLPAGRRSDLWTKASLDKSQEALFSADHFSAQSLGGHFYYVKFYYQ